MLALLVAVLRIAAPAHALAGSAQVRLSPASLQVGPGQTADVTVEVDGVQDLYGADVRLSFDPNILEVVDADPAKDGIQVSQGAFLDTGFTIRNQADNAAGTVWFAATQLNPSTPKSGTGALVVVKLHAKAAGRSPLTVTKADMARRDGTKIQSEFVSGEAQVGQAGASPADAAPVATQPAAPVAAQPAAPAAAVPAAPAETPTSNNPAFTGIAVALAVLAAIIIIATVVVARRRKPAG